MSAVLLTPSEPRLSEVDVSAVCRPGWEVAGDHIRSGVSSSDNDYLILTLHVPGFRYVKRGADKQQV